MTTTFAQIGAQAKSLSSIKNVSAVSFGQTFTDRGKEYTHMLCVDLSSKQALNEYQIDPIHVKFLDLVKPNIDQVLAMDIENQ
jgi:hypothetical protein